MLAFTGATEGLVNMVLGVDTSPIVLVALMILTVVALGMVMGPVPIMLVTLPIFVPVVEQLGFDAIWFAVLYLIAIETGSTSPPFGAGLFVMKGVAPAGTTHERDLPRGDPLPDLRCDRDRHRPCLPGDRRLADRPNVLNRPSCAVTYRAPTTASCRANRAGMSAGSRRPNPHSAATPNNARNREAAAIRARFPASPSS